MARTKTSEIENATQIYPSRRFVPPTAAMGKLSDRHQIPNWLHLTMQILESVASWQTSLGWQISLRPYTIMREDCPAITYCRDGDLDGLRLLFRDRQASPFDRCDNGYTLLTVSRRNIWCCADIVEHDS